MKKSYNYPLSRGKWDALEGGVRVPLIIAGPGIKSGSESATPVSGSDLLPTIVDLAGNKTTRLSEVMRKFLRQYFLIKMMKELLKC